NATVNYATESASVSYDPSLTAPEDLIKVIQDAGYDAYDASPAAKADASKDETQSLDGTSPADIAREEEASHLKRLTIMSGALSLPIMLVSMIPALQFDYWQWLSAILATIVFINGGAPFHKATWTNIKHGSFTMGIGRADRTSPADIAREEEASHLKRLTIMSGALSLPIMLVSMIPALQFDYWQWLSAILATIVFINGGAPFHKATWTNIKHGSFTMDTLITMGTSAAYFWSLYVMVFGHAGMPE